MWKNQKQYVNVEIAYFAMQFYLLRYTDFFFILLLG